MFWDFVDSPTDVTTSHSTMISPMETGETDYTFSPVSYIRDFHSVFSLGQYSSVDNDQSDILIDDYQMEKSNVTREEEFLVYEAGPREEMEGELRKKIEIDSHAKERFVARLRELEQEAEAEELEINSTSRKDFLGFIKGLPFSKPGMLALLDNGNLKATWRGGEWERLTLEFQGSGRVHHVILKRRDNQQSISWGSGEDTLHGVKAQISALDVVGLLSSV